MPQLVKCLLTKHEGLSLDPLHLNKNLDMAVHVHNPSPGEPETRPSLELALWPASLAKSVIFGFSERSCFRK